MKAGDLIKVMDVTGGVHPVGVVVKMIQGPLQAETAQLDWYGNPYAMVAYQDGDYEELELDVPVEVLSASE